jgi:hypothetical protein
LIATLAPAATLLRAQNFRPGGNDKPRHLAIMLGLRRHTKEPHFTKTAEFWLQFRNHCAVQMQAGAAMETLD